MELTVTLFAALKDAAGKNQIRILWKPGMTCRDILEELKSSQLPAGLVEHSFIAINGSYAEQDSSLSPEDEVAVLPPVSGG